MKMTGLKLVGLTPINLPLFGLLPTDKFILKGVTGLGPVEFDVAVARGEFRKRTPHDREVVVRIGLNPNWSSGETASDLRSTIYGLLAGGLSGSADPLISVQVVDGETVKAQTTGTVRLIEINNFVKEPEVQVTISCLSAELDSPYEVVITDAWNSATRPIYNEGSMPVGFATAFTLVDYTPTFSIRMGPEELGNQMTFDFDQDDLSVTYDPGSTVILYTQPGNRMAWMISDADPIGFSLLPHMTPDSRWVVLLPGTNDLVVSEEVSEWSELRYQPRHWGI